MKTVLVLGGLTVLAVAAQGTVLQGALPPGLTPDLALALTLLGARSRGALAGAALGCWAGLLTGALRGGLGLPMGAVYAAAGWLAGFYFETAGQRTLEVACLVASLSLGLAAAEAMLMAWIGVPYLGARPFVLPGVLWNVLVLTPLLELVPARS